MVGDEIEIKGQLGQLKVALVHDYLMQDGGAERVLAAFQRIFPSADSFVTVYNPKRTHPHFAKKKIKTSFLNKFPLAKTCYEWYLPLYPVAIEHLDFSGYDLILSSSISFAKGVIVPAQAKHICYMHTPTRFLWEHRIEYLNDLPHAGVIRSAQPRCHHWSGHY